MAQLNLLFRFDARNAVLACRDTFLTENAREAFALAAFAPDILPSHSIRVSAMMEQVQHSLAECAKAMASARRRGNAWVWRPNA